MKENLFSIDDLKQATYDWNDLHNKTLNIQVVEDESEYITNIYGIDEKENKIYLLHSIIDKII